MRTLMVRNWSQSVESFVLTNDGVDSFVQERRYTDE